jgi:hypothetical protein
MAKPIGLGCYTRGRVLCEVPRDATHALSIYYRDAIERGSGRDRHDINERLRPALVAKIAQNSLCAITKGPLRLLPDDLNVRD